MNFTLCFDKVTPAPLVGVIDFDTDLWQKLYRFESHEKYKIIAPSGKGKSTFIHSIYGLRFDYAGEIKINGQDVKSFTANQWADLRQNQVSIVFQDLRLFLHLTARENINVKSALYEDYNEEKIVSMAETLGVSTLLHKKCNTLSYGERQRIAIIRALIQPFDLLLLDEPFSHLDKENSVKASRLIEAEVYARGAGFIMTSLGQDDYFNDLKVVKL